MLAIEAKSVRKIYKPKRNQEIVALQGLDLEVREGDVFGFVGPNGAGKTTCIKILAGLGWPTDGQALIFGEPSGSVQARQRLGYLPEVSAYHDFMAVGELLMLHASLAGVPAAERRNACEEALHAVRLLDRRQSRIRELSKGMQQRFGIAQAMVGRPSLLILDELTSGLDPLAQKEVKDIVLDLKGRGITIFFSSHKLTEVENICDYIGILHRGRLLRCSPLKDLVEPGATVEVRLKASAEAAQALRSREVEVIQEEDGFCVRVPPARVDEILDTARAGGASIRSVAPQRLSLEEAFFHLIQEADKARD